LICRNHTDIRYSISTNLPIIHRKFQICARKKTQTQHIIILATSPFRCTSDSPNNQLDVRRNSIFSVITLQPKPPLPYLPPGNLSIGCRLFHDILLFLFAVVYPDAEEKCHVLVAHLHDPQSVEILQCFKIIFLFLVKLVNLL
jgi:hypothetical protein